MTPNSHQSQRAELLMPVSDEQAIRQFEIEALRQITDNLRRLNDSQVEQSKLLSSIDGRLIRIESNSVSADVETLKSKVDSLESDRDKRIGAVGLAQWMFKNWPGVIAFGGLVYLILKVTGKAP